MEKDGESQATTTSFVEDRSNAAEEPGAKGDSGEETATPAAAVDLHQKVGKHEYTLIKQADTSKALKLTSSSGEALESQSAEVFYHTKARTRIADIETTLKTLA